jgi:hypothetical protein
MTNLAAPQSSGTDYLKLEAGENRLRIVSHIIDGWETWTHINDDHKVHRRKDQYKATELRDLGVEGSKQKQFYAAVVWNYKTERFECMVVTQKAIKEGIYYTSIDKDWGDVSGYDLVINRKGTGMDTSYSVMPKPHSAFESEEATPGFNLEALYGGGDPFEVVPEEANDDLPM